MPNAGVKRLPHLNERKATLWRCLYYTHVVSEHVHDETISTGTPRDINPFKNCLTDNTPANTRMVSGRLEKRTTQEEIGPPQGSPCQ